MNNDQNFEPYTDYLEDVRVSYNITVRHTILDPATPSIASPPLNTIIMNDAYRSNIATPFEYAHEIGHVINKNSGQAVYGFSEQVRSAEERAAHEWALDAFYRVAEINDYVPNYIEAMMALGLPISFEPLVRNTWLKYSRYEF